MNIYFIEQDLVGGWDTYDSAVVAAESEDDARKVHPSSFVTHVTDEQWMGTYSGGPNAGKEYYQDESDCWVKFSDIGCIKVSCLGETDHKRGLILASFNAGSE